MQGLEEKIRICRDIPKIIKFKATTSLRVSCLFCTLSGDIQDNLSLAIQF